MKPRLPWLLLVATVLAAAAAELERDTLHVSESLRVRVRQGRDIELEAKLAEGEDYASIARALTGSEAQAEALSAWNGQTAAAPGRWVRVPLGLLTDELRALVLRTLFPRDRHEGTDWLHWARAGLLPSYDEGMWQVAQWFSGNGREFEALMRANGLESPELGTGQLVRIPDRLLHASLKARTQSADGALEFGSDSQGAYAAYRLKQGEALYSAVVVRFTGQTAAEEVHALARQLAQRSNIRDPHDIPVNYEVKIPLELLEPEFLPAGHPRRLEQEAKRAELAQALAKDPVPPTRGGLRGVLLILDVGHGGRDLGTMHNGVWEHDYVYDVACRLKQQLERETEARVVMTLLDLETGCEPSAGDLLAANRQGTIQTTPGFLAKELGEAPIGVNLRWYLANSIFRRTVKEGTDPDRVVFLSLHADSRHPSLRGLMVYVPGEGYRAGTYGQASGTYRKFEEVREKPFVQFTKSERVRSEAVSRKLAEAIVHSFKREGLPLQAYQPIRDRIVRGRNKWLPAVLRGNAVPNKVLVELVNLSNPEDAAVLGSARWRERLAHGLLGALYRHFGETAPARPPSLTAAQVAAASGPATLDSP
jgi:N-acetylmuramoyl-L-alanine amidase